MRVIQHAHIPVALLVRPIGESECEGGIEGNREGWDGDDTEGWGRRDSGE